MDNQDIHLSKKEFLILAYLVSHAGKLVMQNTILKGFGVNVMAMAHSIKLSACKKQPLITTENAIGYRFAVAD